MDTLLVQARGDGRVVSWQALNRGAFVDQSRLFSLSPTTVLTDVIVDVADACFGFDPGCRIEVIRLNSYLSTILHLAFVGKAFRVECKRQLVRGHLPWIPWAAEIGSNYDVTVAIDAPDEKMRGALLSMLEERYPCRRLDPGPDGP